MARNFYGSEARLRELSRLERREQKQARHDELSTIRHRTSQLRWTQPRIQAQPGS